MVATGLELVELMEQTCSSVDEVCAGLGAGDWDLPTDCPGWSVKDNLSHLVHFEATAIGRPSPEDIDVSYLDRVTDDFQATNERGVEARRARSGPEVLAEFREVVAERLAALRAPDALAGTVSVPVGEFPEEAILPIRVTDLFYHEQDIRRAVDRPGHLGGAVAAFVFDRMASLAMPRVVAKGARAPEGSSVVFDVDGARTTCVVVRDGKGVLDEVPAEPTVRFVTDLEAFLCVVGGRWTLARATGLGRWKSEGDATLAAAIEDAIVVVP